MANPKLETLVDPFSAAAINTTVWDSVTPGAATLDTVNDLVVLAVPTASGATNSFGSSLPFDATSSSVYAQIGVAANGAGTTRTVIKLTADASNSVSMRLENGAFLLRVQSAGANADTTLAAYSPHAHRWWRIRENSGTWYADASPDGLTWTTLASQTHGWSATAVTLFFQAGANGTEVAGNVVTIGNINTHNGGPLNLNWPLIEDGWAPFWGSNAGAMPANRYVNVTERTRGTMAAQRGRQYELDQVRSGEASLTLANTDAALDPVNTSGPWAGHIVPYQPYRKRAQWPPTRNLCDQAFATGGDLGGYALGAISVFADITSDSDSSGGSFVTAADAWQGGTVMQFAVPAATAASSRIMHSPHLAVTPGKTYTMQMRVRNISASSTLSVKALFGWYVAGTTSTPNSFVYGTPTTLTGSATAGWTTLTLTATAPPNAAGIDVGVAVASTAATSVQIQVDGCQVETGSVATPWACPGAWYALYAGWTERWPSSWDLDGTYGLVEPSVVDSFSLLSQQTLADSLTMELNGNSPRFVYKLDDPAGSVALADWTGNNPPVQIGIGKYGAGSITLGNAVTANDPAAGVYTGSTGTVATVVNSNPGTNLVTGGASFIKLGQAGILGPADPSQWTRMIAFRYTGPTPTNMAVMWSSFSRARANGFPSGSQMWWYIDSDGYFRVAMGGPSVGTTSYKIPTPILMTDGNWHLVLVTYSRANAKLEIRLDQYYYYWTGIDPGIEPTNLISDNIGTWVDPTVGNGTTFNFKGDLAFVAEFPTVLSTSATFQIYTAWRQNCAGEPSNTRYLRILRYAGYTGDWHVEPGLTSAMGPADIDGQDAMTALQAVVDTEGGAHFFDAGGRINFLARSARYNATTPAYTFGERVDLGEWPYEEVTLDFDSTHLSNQVTVSQEGTGQNFYAVDDASVTAYFPRTLSRTINAQDPNECQDAANYLLSRYRQPATRVSSLRLHPGGNPALWAVCLSLELGTRVRVMRRPPNAPPIQVECFVENLAWEFSEDNDASLTIQCSPADLTPYGVFGIWHTTLFASAAAGSSTVNVKAPSDNLNLLLQQIVPGQQLVLGQGTGNAETVTVAAVGPTSSGWISGALTLTAPTTKAHAAGDLVCEPLPSGTTDPTKWDAISKFDSIAFSY
ncbi:hypothetical protein ACFVY4_26650 [Streptomyces sp. NPDC058299]|uniref:hypothetical protein n=1 Tax=Streptomyces sp. NPDC058299 TaxID=3346435 RepID=UPI0036F0F58C